MTRGTSHLFAVDVDDDEQPLADVDEKVDDSGDDNGNDDDDDDVNDCLKCITLC